MPRVAIVYLSYNATPYLDGVFFSLGALNYPKDRLEIIVVDNASSDGSQERLRSMSGFTFFPSAKNLGFAAGNNLGIEHAIAEGTEYIYLLNNDAKLDPNAITEAVALAESDSTIGSVQSFIKLWQDESRVNSTGGMVHFLGFGFVRDNGRLQEEITIADCDEIAYASGAAVLYRASVLKKVGVLDPFLFLYHEDLELGWRIRLAGYRNVISLRSIAFHQYEFKRSIQKFFWMERNRLLVFASHLSVRTLFFLAPFLFAAEISLLFFANKNGWMKQKFLVYRDLFRFATVKYLFHKRTQSKQLRRASDHTIVALWTGNIEHQEMQNPLVEHVINPVLDWMWLRLKKWI